LHFPRAIALAILLCAPRAAYAFPPYRSTDAETAPPGTLEARLGLIRVEREEHDNRYASPLLRVNLGVLRNLEVISELEYDTEEDRVGDGAAGIKWASSTRPSSIGVETLALLPVTSGHSGAGLESQLLATFRWPALRVHCNAGGFYDPRGKELERGLRGSLLLEAERGRARYGGELFARRRHGEGLHLEAGPGVIVDLGRFDVRTALHVGLTSEAPDFRASLWVSWKRRVWPRPAAGGRGSPERLSERLAVDP
jgi:hypothetical protein